LALRPALQTASLVLECLISSKASPTNRKLGIGVSSFKASPTNSKLGIGMSSSKASPTNSKLGIGVSN
ncbi:MAG: hypothetical protein ACJBCI_06500, partial [Candidatus Tisiphia sp.]